MTYPRGVSQEPLVRPTGSGPARLLVSLMLLLGVLAMHGLTMDHNAGVGAASASMSMASAPVGTLTVPVAAAPARAIQVALPVMTALPAHMPGMLSMLGGMCLAVLLAVGICLLLRRAGSAKEQRRWLAVPLRHRSFGLLPGHDPPGALLLRLCVMRT